MVKIYIAETSGLKNELLFQKLYDSVPLNRQEKISRIKFPKDKQLSLGAFILLQKSLDDFGVDGSKTEFIYGPEGKPFLKDYPEIFFNLSHSDERVMCAVSDQEIGCDVEKIKDCNLKVAKRFFHAREYEALMSLPSAEAQKDRFYRLWTLKESFMKVTGLGMKLPLDSFCIDISDLGVSIEQHVNEQKSYFLKEFDLKDGYQYACCGESDDFEDKMKIIDLGEVR